MGSHTEPWTEFAAPLGRWIAEQGHHLLTGAGTGTMAAVAEAFCAVASRRGVSIGVVPTFPDNNGGYFSKPGYPNPWIEVPIYSPLPSYDGTPQMELSRNHINVMTSHVVIALPGSKGTQNEVELALRYKKPVALFGPEKSFDGFPPLIERCETLEGITKFVGKQLTGL